MRSAHSRMKVPNDKEFSMKFTTTTHAQRHGDLV